MLTCREKVGGSQRIPLLTLNEGESMKLKRDYEDTFKEGFRLGVRLTRAKACLENARNAKILNDEPVFKLQMEFANDWSELAAMQEESLHRPRLTTQSNLLLILVTSKCKNIYQSCHIN